MPTRRMKLIIQIPCFERGADAPARRSPTFRASVDGFDAVEWLIIDDGSTDRTIEVARAHGVDHIVRLTNNKGLAAGFQAGLDACLKLGADVIVNTDADNQYYGGDIPKLVAPILAGSADMVVGDREVQNIEHFSPLKKRCRSSARGSCARRRTTEVPDTTSGFRAYNREAAIQMVVVSKFTYTLETIIQAGKLLVAIDHVPIRTNPKTRESRLFPSMWSYVRRNAVSIFRIYAQYEPLKVFMTLGRARRPARARRRGRASPTSTSRGDGAGHVQSLILGAVLFNAAMVLAALGIIGDLLCGQRMMRPAHLRARAAHRAAARRRAVALRARRAPTGHAADDRRARRATGKTEEREALQL